MTLADKTVLITGANRGIGRALAAEALARNARRVYAGTRRPLAHPDPRVKPLTLDVTRGDQVQAAAAEVGTLDLLINNAGILLRDDLTDPAAIERHLDVNLFGTYTMTQAFLPALSQSRGAIVNILSVNALAPMPLMPAYSISKAAAFSLTQSLRVLLAGQGVRVHAVLPGPVDTDIMGGQLTDERKAAMSADTLLGRVGTQDEVAALIAFLLGDDAGWITAATYDINGGLQVS